MSTNYGKRPKYKNTKVVVDGIKFDSKKEAARYTELKMFEEIGAIKDLELQKEFTLIPAQKDLETNKVVERAVKYKADFCYIARDTGEYVVEDVKSEFTKTKEYILKRKMMLYFHGIRIQEI